MLTLPITREWFDLIECGYKKEEYREIKPYYDSRFKELGVPTVIRFRAGYSKDAPVIECRVIIAKGKGKEKWGAIPGEMYYVLSIKKVKLIRNTDETGKSDEKKSFLQHLKSILKLLYRENGE